MQIAEIAIRARVAFASVGQSRSMVGLRFGADAIVMPFDGWVTLARAVGVSPRGSIALYKAAQALAAIRGRDYVVPEDIKELLIPVFRKRLIVRPEFLMKGYRSETIIAEISTAVPIPSFRERA